MSNIPKYNLYIQYLVLSEAKTEFVLNVLHVCLQIEINH